jgi:hypothetical protein
MIINIIAIIIIIMIDVSKIIVNGIKKNMNGNIYN